MVAEIIVANLLTYFMFLPAAQSAADSHMNSGPFFGTVFYLVSVILSLFGLNALVRQRDYKSFILLLFFAATLTFWGYRIHSLICLGCFNCG